MPGRYRSLRFRPGRVVITPGALRALQEAGQDAVELLSRHLAGDWGPVCDADKQANDEAVAHEGDPDSQQRVLSAYESKLGQRIWVITESDRSATTILLPDEY